MREDFNRKVFESMPDSVYRGSMPSLPGRKRHSFNFVYAAAAACVAALAFSTAFLAARLAQQPEVSQPIARAEISYTVNRALQGSIVLPDSTLVTLNSGSTLTLAEDFGIGTRTVYLDGEGYFDVHKDRAVPFMIRTPQDVLVKVTGTRFNVKCYSDDPKFDLTLLQGSVEVTTRSNEVIRLAPSEELMINSDFHNVSRVADPEENLAWRDGVLRFNHSSMRETISQIERWYGVDVTVEDESLYRNSFTAEFRSETLTEVLDLLCIASRLEYTVTDGTVTLKSKTRK